jgi:hypothetical protein
MLDAGLASLYEVPVKVLSQAVKRNAIRFPDDFMFQFTKAEVLTSGSQIVTADGGRGGRRIRSAQSSGGHVATADFVRN